MKNWEQIASQYFKSEFDKYKTKISGGRRPDSVNFTDINNDVKRRDLTINALFYDIDTREIVDLVGGVEDIKNGVVRTVGKAEDRFGEDRLRIMRAVRFAGRFGSNLDSTVDAALKNDASLIGISPERIRDEFLKGISSAKSVVHFLQTLNRYHLFQWVFKSLQVSNDFVEGKDSVIVIATLLKDNYNKDIRKTLVDVLKYEKEEARTIGFLISLQKLTTESAVLLKRQQAMAGVTSDQIIKFCSHIGMNMKLVNTFIKFELSVSGDELMTKFNIKGAEVGKRIQDLETNNFRELL